MKSMQSGEIGPIINKVDKICCCVLLASFYLKIAKKCGRTQVHACTRKAKKSDRMTEFRSGKTHTICFSNRNFGPVEWQAPKESEYVSKPGCHTMETRALLLVESVHFCYRMITLV